MRRRITWTTETMGKKRVQVGWPHGVSRTKRGRRRGQIRNVDVEAVAATMPHRRGLPAHLQTDQRAENPLGRLRLLRLISEAEYLAGLAYRECIMRYRAVIDCPTESPPSIAGVFEVKRGGGRGISDRAAVRRKEEFQNAFHAMEMRDGTRVARAVAHVVVAEREPGAATSLVRQGLRTLARHFRLVRRNR